MLLSKESLGKAIKSRRKELGLTQIQLAEMSKMSQQHISLIEKGHLEPNLRTLDRLFSALQWKVSLQPVPQSESLNKRLQAFQKFNAWEIAQSPILSPEEAFDQSEALMKAYRRLHGEFEPLSLEQQAQAWKTWRSRLSLLP